MHSGELGWGPHTNHLGTTQVGSVDRCRASSSLAVTGQSNKTKMHNHLGNQKTGKAVTWQFPDSPSPPPTLFLSLHPPPTHTHNTVPFNVPLRSQDSVCEEMRGNEENRKIQDVGKQNTFSKQGREVKV